MKTSSIESGALKVEQQSGLKRWRASFTRNASDPHPLRLFYGSENELPAYAFRGACTAIFDGVLYGCNENAANVVLDEYIREGDQAIHKLRGLFAVIIWDGQRSLLLCARDQLGVHSFFYADTARELLLSSCIESLLQSPSLSKKVNRAALADQLCHRFPFPDETFFENVKRILAGHILREDGTGQITRRYWDPVPLDRPVEFFGSEGLEQFDSRFEQAISRCLSLGPAGIFLSGGLDSVSVAGMAADVAKKNGRTTPWALSIAFPHPECREEDIQKGVAAGLGLPQLLVPFEETIGKKGLLAAAVEMSTTLPSPTLNAWKPAYVYLAQQAHQKGCRVILNGAGGDEWLTVNPRYAADLIRALNLSGLFRLTGNFLRSYRLPRVALTRYVIWNSGFQPLLALYAAKGLKRFMPDRLKRHRLKNLNRTTRYWVAPDPQLRAELQRRVDHTLEKLMSVAEPAGKHGFYFSTLPNSFVNPLKSIEFEEEFVIGKRLGVRIIPPYYDPDLLDVLLRLPPEMLHYGGREKALVRQSLARRFPHLKFEKQKKASALNFFQTILLTEGPIIWDKIGGLYTLERLGIVNHETMDTIFKESMEGGIHYQTHRLWELLTLEMWSRQHVL